VEAIADRVGIIRRGEVVEIAATQALIERAVRRITIRFKQPSDLAAITALPGVKLISHDASHCQLQVEGDMDQLIKALALYPVADLEIERTSLEEIFLAYYDEVRP
jgi:ABC-2 type transport system ATP-binding protein